MSDSVSGSSAEEGSSGLLELRPGALRVLYVLHLGMAAASARNLPWRLGPSGGGRVTLCDMSVLGVVLFAASVSYLFWRYLASRRVGRLGASGAVGLLIILAAALLLVGAVSALFLRPDLQFKETGAHR